MTTEVLPSSPCHPVTPSPCPSPPTPVSVDTLLKLLQQGHTDIDDLCAQLVCTPEALENALDSKLCEDRLRLKTKLAHTAPQTPGDRPRSQSRRPPGNPRRLG